VYIYEFSTKLIYAISYNLEEIKVMEGHGVSLHKQQALAWAFRSGI
jgi:hypothetical protein